MQLLQEVLASHIAGVPAQGVQKDASFYKHALARAKLDTKALKMAFYGFFISAPLGHLLVGLLQKVFAGRSDLKAKIGQILASNLVVAPIQVSSESSSCLPIIKETTLIWHAVYLASMAIINGAKTKDDIMRTVKGGFMNVMRVCPPCSYHCPAVLIYRIAVDMDDFSVSTYHRAEILVSGSK